MTTIDKVKKIAVALYGDRWQHAAARDLGVHHRQLTRWISGEYNAPDEILESMAKIAMQRIATIDRETRKALKGVN